MSKYITYVIRLPDAQESKAAITSGVRALVEQHGGSITGQSAEDEMTLAEMFEKRRDDIDAKEARQEAAALGEAN